MLISDVQEYIPAFEAKVRWPKCPDPRCLERAPTAKRQDPERYIQWRLHHDCLYDQHKEGNLT